MQAVVEVESGRLGGFAADGRPIILFEPHIFSRRTNRMYDASHPTISYPTWDASKYPRTQDERWDQLQAAYALDPQNAVRVGELWSVPDHGLQPRRLRLRRSESFVTDMCRSAKRSSSKAFAAFVRANNLADELHAQGLGGLRTRLQRPGPSRALRRP